MSHQFKPGDLALTLVDRCGLSAMSQVEIVEYVEPGSRLKTIYGDYKEFTVPVWQVSAASIPQGCILFRQKELVPLRGDFAPEQQKAKEEEPCL